MVVCGPKRLSRSTRGPELADGRRSSRDRLSDCVGTFDGGDGDTLSGVLNAKLCDGNDGGVAIGSHGSDSEEII